ncbi:MAG: 50S ribosomal protein L11 methyltransferase [Bacteroidota bacterium]
MNYYKVSITSSPDKKDLIMALMSEANYDGFEENDFGFKTYIEESAYQPAFVQDLADRLDFSYKAKLIPQQNWNAIWESNFPPIQLDNFCGIRADFHPPFTDVTHEIVINPKMAFGTGHHETTFSMMTIMRQLDFSGKRVFDYGCGTGILAILASKMGADSILAIDYDPLSYENTVENCQKNQITNVTPQLGELASVEANNFDLILANINRNVILDSLASLFTKTKERGQVLISGFLHSDEDMMATTVDIIGFSIKNVARRGEWICMQLEK